MLIEQPENVAYPLTTVLLDPLVHDSVPPPALVPMDRVTTVELSPVTIMPREQRRSEAEAHCPSCLVAHVRRPPALGSHGDRRGVWRRDGCSFASECELIGGPEQEAFVIAGIPPLSDVA